MSISKNIKAIRDRFNLTQTQLGEIAGVSDKAVSTWENGTAEPRLGTIQKISDALNIRKSDIIDGNLSGSSSFSPTAPLQLSNREERLVASFRCLNDEGQDKVMSYMDDLSGMDKYRLSDLEARMWEDADGIAKDEYEKATRLKKCNGGM